MGWPLPFVCHVNLPEGRYYVPMNRVGRRWRKRRRAVMGGTMLDSRRKRLESTLVRLSASPVTSSFSTSSQLESPVRLVPVYRSSSNRSQRNSTDLSHRVYFLSTLPCFSHLLPLYQVHTHPVRMLGPPHRCRPHPRLHPWRRCHRNPLVNSLLRGSPYRIRHQKR